MTLQQIQADLSRCYRGARAAVGDPGDLSGVPEPTATTRPATPAAAGDVRHET
jgi:hypothetical protein